MVNTTQYEVYSNSIIRSKCTPFLFYTHIKFTSFTLRISYSTEIKLYAI